MATINQLLAKDELILYEAELEPHMMPERLIYLSSELAAWIGDVLDLEEMDRGRDLDPSEQVESILDQFVAGHHMGRSELRKLEPLGNGIWEFKPTDVRIFGYFYRKSFFIATCGEMKKKLKKRSDYQPYINKALASRDSYDLPPPSHLDGDLYDLI